MFRLTEDEYALLKKASFRARRSLSDFTRAELLTSLVNVESAEQTRSLRQLGEQLSKLDASVDDLKQLVSTRISEPAGMRARKAAPRRREGPPR